MLIDEATLHVKGGRGGDGCSSLYKDVFHRKGVPDGGSGGDGGSVLLMSDENLHTLLDFKYKRHYKAADGGRGGSNNKQGKKGRDLVVKVPVGTVAREAGEDLVIRDLSSKKESVVVAAGGRGGKGNAARRIATAGEDGEKRTLFLELKFIADAGIIGFPNAGKSTLVSRISNARVKIASYPFTTKAPQLGVVAFRGDSFVVADMPGLIEGAHAGRGLGDAFLRHIERTSVLVHMVEMMPPDSSDPAENFFKLEKELKLYDADVAAKPRIVVAAKMDVTGSEEALKVFRKKIKKKVIPISAVTGEGIGELVGEMYKKIKSCGRRSEIICPGK